MKSKISKYLVNTLIENKDPEIKEIIKYVRPDPLAMKELKLPNAFIKIFKI